MFVPKFQFYKNRYRFLAFSLVLLIVGFICLFTFGARLDIQFKGGSIITYSHKGEVDLNEVEKVVTSAINYPVNVQETTSLDIAKGNDLVKSVVISVAVMRHLLLRKALNLILHLNKNLRIINSN